MTRKTYIKPGIRNISLCLITSILMIACAEKAANGVVVDIDSNQDNGVRMVRLEVMGDRLIRVTATPEGSFSREKSLVVVPQEERTPFEVVESDSSVAVKTAQMTAVVDRQTGNVNFLDNSGNTILAEDRRSFIPIEVEGTEAYTVQQLFRSAGDDEGLYGLGQHQADEFNYKGRNEELFQYNTKVSVPFIVSTRNYGILWDSYSLLRFGNPDDYSQLGEVFRLYDKHGVEGALTGTYTPKSNKSKPMVRREDSIYFEHLDRETKLSEVVNLPKGFNFNGATVVYEGEIEPQESATYRFILYYAGYMKVFVDNEPVVPERWRTSWNPNSYKFAADLEKGRRVPLRIEWKPDGGVSYCGLRVMKPTSPEEQQKMSWWGEMQNEIDYYFVGGESMDDVISGYRTLTGKAQVMPKWAMGYWQSRERYKTQKELLSTLKEFRTRQIPIDNIVQDWSYWREDAWGSHEFDEKRFPDPKAMVDSVHAMNGRLMISVWPKFYEGIEHYREFDSKGWMYRQAVNDSIKDWIGKGYVGSFYDAYSEGARKLFWQQMNDHLYSLGIDAWWMDASEPNIRDCTDMQYRKALCGPTALGPSAKYFNAYALMNAEAIYDGQRSVNPDDRVFLLTRSGFAGLQRYSTATWSGDIATRWEDMKAQISAGLNFAMSGIPYWTMDIGGFCVENRYVAAQKEYNKTKRENEDMKEWRELNTRWYQFGAFCPLFRSHGQYPYREPWHIAPENHPAYRSMVDYTRLRYRLMPYIYTLAGMTHFADYTIMRPLAMDFTTDTETHNIGDQYMFGPSLMVAPVYEYGTREREVYLPKGCGWYDYHTGRHTEGGQTVMAAAPYEHIPLFVPDGAIIPFGPAMQYSSELPADTITLLVYGGRDGAFTLYEDEGTNYNYEKGMHSTIPITFDNATATLTIGKRRGEFPGMKEERTFNVVHISKKRPDACNPDANGIIVSYDGKELTVRISE